MSMGRQHQNEDDDEKAETIADMILGNEDEWLAVED